MQKRFPLVRCHLGLLALIACSSTRGWAQELPAAAPATERFATYQVRVAPDRSDWTYRPGETVKFSVSVTADNGPLPGAPVQFSIGPEMMPAETKTAVTPSSGALVLDGGTMKTPGFLRCIVTYERDGTVYRGLATAGFSPEKIVPTQKEPADFESFWAGQKAELAKLPIDARLTPMPESSTSRVEVFHVSLQNVGDGPTGASRFYGILCVPRAAGPYPGLLCPPGAGIRAYHGEIEMAEKGFITFQFGIHGIPVNLPEEVYDSLSSGALANYPLIDLDRRDRYYFRRVYLGCLRANDFLVSDPKWDHRNLVVMGGSQGGQLSIVTAALDPRVTACAVAFPAYCDVMGYLFGRAGGWPRIIFDRGSPGTPEKVATTGYYDVVNFARHLRVPGTYAWGYNDETCPPTSMFSAYNVISAPKRLSIALETGHAWSPLMNATLRDWVLKQVGR